MVNGRLRSAENVKIFNCCAAGNAEPDAAGSGGAPATPRALALLSPNVIEENYAHVFALSNRIISAIYGYIYPIEEYKAKNLYLVGKGMFFLITALHESVY